MNVHDEDISKYIYINNYISLILLLYKLFKKQEILTL